MLQQVSFAKIDFKELGIDFEEISRDYLPVKVATIIPNSLLPCDIFFPMVTNSAKGVSFETLLKEEDLYKGELQEVLSDKGIQEVYINRARENDYIEYLTRNVGDSIRSTNIVPTEKTRLLYHNAESIVRKMFRESPTPLTVKMGKEFVAHFETHLSLDKITADMLFSLFSKDYGTFSHSVQVALLGMCFCKFLGWSREEVTEFGLAALFHDIGKSLIDERILNKPCSLEEEEYEAIKQHTVLGYRQLQKTRSLSVKQLKVALSHHEAMDGSGYPEGLSGDEIHKYARVARIVDCFDALTTRRPYKEAMPRSKVLQLMKREMIHTFDAGLLGAFIGFLQSEDKARDSGDIERIRVQLGSQLMIQFEGEDLRVKATLVGMEPGEYLIVRIPVLSHIQKYLHEGGNVIVRHIHSGTIYGFKSKILGDIAVPSRLLFVSYPNRVETVNLRKDPRIECFIPASADIQGSVFPGVIMDLCVGGCKFVLKHTGGQKIPLIQMGESIVVNGQLFGEDKAAPFPGRVRNINQDETRTYLGIQFMDLNKDSLQNLTRCMEYFLTLI